MSFAGLAEMLKRLVFCVCMGGALSSVQAQAPEEDAPAGAAPAATAPGGAPPAAAAPPAISPTTPSTPAAPAAIVPMAPAAPPAAASSPPPLPAPAREATTEQRRRENLSDFERKVEVEEAGKKVERAVEAGRAEQDEQEIERLLEESAADAKRRAAAERRAAARRQLVARERSCVIKPVMTDAEIAHCKWVWSFPPPPP